MADDGFQKPRPRVKLSAPVTNKPVKKQTGDTTLALPQAAFPARGSQQIAGGGNAGAGPPRKKIAPAPGYSQLEWNKRVLAGKNLSGMSGMKKVTKEEVARHCTEDDAWMIFRGGVYNITPYLKYHPGGVDELMRAAGRDGTDLFNSVHPWVNAELMLRNCVIGPLDLSPPPEPTQDPESVATTTTSAPGPATAPASSKYYRYMVADRMEVNYNTFLLRVVSPDGGYEEILPGQHVSARAEVGGVVVERPYTPMSEHSPETGHLDLLIKKYDDGIMSTHLSTLQPGDSIDISPPIGSYEYSCRDEVNDYVLVAGGTGITPMLKLINAILLNEDDAARIHLVFANRTEADILLKPLLDALVEENPTQFATLLHVLSQPEGETGHTTGRVTAKLLRDNTPIPSDGTQVLVCGPAGFSGSVVRMVTTELGHSRDRVHVFKAQIESSGPPVTATGGISSGNTLTPYTVPITSVPDAVYTLADVAQHSTADDGWFAIGGVVYDVTEYISKHPGGRTILAGLGADATELFEAAFHSPAARRVMAEYAVGRLVA